jgi:hypothetical protein
MIVLMSGLRGRSRASNIALLAVALMLGALAIAFGLFLLLAVTGVGLVIGIATLLYRKLTGRSAPLGAAWEERAQLDPALEVFPSERALREAEAQGAAQGPGTKDQGIGPRAQGPGKD